VEAPVEYTVAMRSGRRVRLGAEQTDLGVRRDEVFELGCGGTVCGDAGDGAFHAAEHREEVFHVLALIDGDLAPDLRDDLDETVGCKPAERLHDRLLGHAVLGFECLYRQARASRKATFEQPFLERVVEQRGKTLA
jgi:hypothetical protein